jgi:hypothetical protein
MAMDRLDPLQARGAAGCSGGGAEEERGEVPVATRLMDGDATRCDAVAVRTAHGAPIRIRPPRHSGRQARRQSAQGTYVRDGNGDG